MESAAGGVVVVGSLGEGVAAVFAGAGVVADDAAGVVADDTAGVVTDAV
jgi:hypothetical protein